MRYFLNYRDTRTLLGVAGWPQDTVKTIETSLDCVFAKKPLFYTLIVDCEKPKEYSRVSDQTCRDSRGGRVGGHCNAARTIDSTVLLAFLAIFALIYFYAQPLVKRGFFCNDESLGK